VEIQDGGDQMKTVILSKSFSALFLVSLMSAQESAVMHRRLVNQDVIRMVQTGLSEEVIVAKIRATSAADPSSLGFDTSVEGLSMLKAANVPDAVIRVVLNPGAPPAMVITSGAPVTIDPNLPPPEIGVYWKDQSRFVLIEGQALSHAKIGGRAGNMFTYGIRGLHWDAYLNGPASAQVIQERRPMFYIYVPEGSSSSDYSLIKLTKKSNRREFQIGSLAGMMGGGKAGLKSAKEIPFHAEHLGIRAYRLTLERDLDPGEYAFFMATGQQVGSTGASRGQGTGGTITGRIYDFALPE
jgi:hypothetical protein